MRTAFIEQLILEAEKRENIFLLCGDLGFSVLERFRDKFPKRFLNVGISEQNMAGIAAGLAKEGFQVFIYSIANFPTLRCLEQIRYDICYHNLNVKVVAVGAGFSYGPLGSSHHATEDIGVMRVLPGLTLYAPADPIETKYCVVDAVKNSGPCYLRLGKSGEKNLHDGEIDIKGAPVLKAGNEFAYLCTGSIAKHVLNKLSMFDVEIRTFPVVKPLNIQVVKEIAQKFQYIITVEEHQLDSGFGGAIVEVISDLYSCGELEFMPKVSRAAINNKFIDVAGTQEYLIHKNINIPMFF